MGFTINISISCDICNTTILLSDFGIPLPDNWRHVTGYVNTSNEESESINGYFCPDCSSNRDTPTLVKIAADL